MFKKLIENTLLKNFLAIDLSGNERDIAEDSIQQKYVPSLREANLLGLLMVPSILVLDTTILVAVLIPITMVTGAAWFSISLAHVRRKFEDFGLELTTNVLKSFVGSLALLALLVGFSLASPLLPSSEKLQEQVTGLEPLAIGLGILVVLRVLWNLLAGALKYDINDAMLTGQSEVAERFFKKALSQLNNAALQLKEGKKLQVANYHLGVALMDTLGVMQAHLGDSKEYDELYELAQTLHLRPEMSQKEADQVTLKILSFFFQKIEPQKDSNTQELLKKTQAEFKILNEKTEEQELVDARFSSILEGVAELFDLQGETLFIKK